MVRGAAGSCALHELRREVDADHGAPGGSEQPAGELADEAQTDDAHTFPEPDVGLVHAMEGDGSHGRERSRVEADPAGTRAHRLPGTTARSAWTA